MQPPTRCQNCRTPIDRDEELCRDCRFEYEILNGVSPEDHDSRGIYYDDPPPFWLVMPKWRQYP